MVVLHPRRTARITAVDRPALLLAVLGAVPFVVYAWGQLRLQFGPPDPFGHVEANHYFGMAALAGALTLAALLGSTDLPGWRLVAWIAAGSAVLLGIASAVHPDRASAFPIGWALAAVAWGIAYVLVVALRRPRRGVSVDPPPQSTPQLAGPVIDRPGVV